MKHFSIFILLAIFFCKNTNAQKYQPYDTNMVWKVFQTGSATAFNNQCNRTDAYNYYVRNYIINNGRLWHKVYANIIQGNFIHQSFGGNCDPSIIPVNSTVFIGMFSNDTLNKKVYFVPTWSLVPNFTPTDANLIFDSNKTIGDIMSVYSGGDPSTTIGLNYQITLIDSVLLGTKYHKRFTGTTTFWQNYSPTNAYFIEGVGASGGVFNSYFNIFSYKSSKVGCFSNDNYTKYYAGQYNWSMSLGNFQLALRDTNTCFTSLLSGFTKNNLTDNTLSIYPNPTSGVINFEQTTIVSSENYLVRIIDLLGQNVMEEKFESTINISNLKNGIYFLQLFDKEKLIAIEKIIKE
ncbi:MAG: T9SS type A sorting domain-containing protein [Bacteroidota bacterium]|nr:T9SS type A sorting domain-containing protein [Bacteroidota bacterium]MDP3144793.1 T9SS type A sorting domain-containing protein [Bacteroidota bacterium]